MHFVTKVQASRRDAARFLRTDPALETPGYCQRSLQDRLTASGTIAGIQSQGEHQRTRRFEEEVIAFLKKNNVANQFFPNMGKQKCHSRFSRT